MIYFYGQGAEDIYIYNNFINITDTKGIYVELGAVDGELFSISKFFEDCLKFKGILIEPSNKFETLIKKRPNNKCYNLAISDEEECIYLGDGVAAGIAKYMTDDIKSRNEKSNYYTVKCCPFNKIQKETGISYIDIFILDVEGAEEIVLKTIDFSIPIYIMVIELDGNNKEKDENCRNILRNNGFSFDIRTNINEFWVNKNYFRKYHLYDENIPKYRLNDKNIVTPYIDLEHPKINELKNALDK